MTFDELVAQTDRAVQAHLGAVLVIYAPQVGLPVEDVPGMFDEQYVLAKGSAEAGVETLGPAIFFRLEDLPVEPEGDEPTITIPIRDVDVAFRVIERRPDDKGGVVFALRRLT